MRGKPPGRRKNTVTSVDVARAAGISQSVVSRAFSFDASVAKATRKKIFDVAGRLGYRPNLVARSLITSRSNLFALVAEDFTNPLYHSIIAAFSRVAEERGYRLLLFGAPPGKRLDDVMATVLQYRADGILALAGTPSDDIIEECRRSAVPIVLLARERGTAHVSSVSCDNFLEARRVATLLLDARHQRFAFVASRSRTLSFSIDRERGFSETVIAHGKDAPIVENGDSTYIGGYQAAIRLLGRAPRPDAIFCANDAMALGLLDAARHEFGLKIPEELSVVGFDDVPMAAWASYQLSTIRQRVDAMVEAATDILVEHGAAADPTPVSRTISGDLIVRASARFVGGH